MPKFNILLAAESSLYGSIEVESETWQDAVQTLDMDHWYDHCRHRGDDYHELRVVHVENEANEIEAEDVSFDAPLIHSFSVAWRLRHMREAYATREELFDHLDAYIVELETLGRDPLFLEQDKKGA